MIDASGREREEGMPYCVEFKKTDAGCYALVAGADGWVYRYRDGVNETIEVEHDSEEGIGFNSIDDFEVHVKEKIAFGWTDYRGLYSNVVTPTPQPIFNLDPRMIDSFMGAMLLLLPFVLMGFILNWLGWL